MSKYKAGPFLEKIVIPEDLRKEFDINQLPQVSDEVRQFIIDVISEIGNSHFGASLGVVELTVALHYVFNTPYDQLVWDVGHQAYGHKILTGRRDIFHTNRLYGGMSGFPKRSTLALSSTLSLKESVLSSSFIVPTNKTLKPG